LLPLFPGLARAESGLGDWETVGPGAALAVSAPDPSGAGSAGVEVRLDSGREAWIRQVRTLDWGSFGRLSFTVSVPAKAPGPVTFICYLKDRDWNWFQSSLFSLAAGQSRRITLDLSSESVDWQGYAHLKSWDAILRRQLQEIGFKFYWPAAGTGRVILSGIEPETAAAPAELCLYNFRENTRRLELYARFETAFEIPLFFDNPFDPAEVDIQGVFSAPSGRQVSVPAFIYQDFVRHLDQEEGERLAPYGKTEWRLRFTPQETGRYTYRITLKTAGRSQEFPGGEFEVTPSNRPGFLRWDKQDPRWLALDNGEFFYPIGHTLRSPDDQREAYRYEFKQTKGWGTFLYDDYFREMARHDENYVRLWMSAWWAGLEWTPAYAPHYDGLGRYSLENAWRQDLVLERAEETGIYAILTLINHGQYSAGSDREWWDNPHNVVNGGFLKSPEEFFTDPLAREYFKRRLRYLVARWGSSTSIAFWELWNEVDLTGYYDSARVKGWHQAVVPYLREIDPWDHLVTTHYCRQNADPLVWVIPEIESIVGNAYSGTVVDAMKDFFLKRVQFAKPVMLNEYGVGGNRTALEDNLHAGIWTSSVLPMFGTALFWEWPFIHNFGLYTHYQALARFWKGEDRRGQHLQVSDASLRLPTGSSLTLGVVGMQSEDRAFLWVYDGQKYNGKRGTPNPERFEGVGVEVRALQAGRYRVEYWDTLKGELRQFSEGTVASDGLLPLVLPVFQGDLAVKVKRVQS